MIEIATNEDMPNSLNFSSECLDFLVKYLFEGTNLEKKENGSNTTYQISEGNKKIKVSKLLNDKHKKLCKKIYDCHLKKPNINNLVIPLNEEERLLFSDLHRTLIDIYEGKNSASIALIQSWKKVGMDTPDDNWTSIRMEKNTILRNDEIYKRL